MPRDIAASRAARLLPMAMLAVAVVVITWFCRDMLLGAVAGEATVAAELPLYVAAGCFLLAAGAVVVLQSVQVAERVAGPEYRLVQSLRRIRGGDLSFRVHLRKGDLLGGLAQECNELLEWLNQNPPSGARTGSDLLEVAELSGEENSSDESLVAEGRP